MVLRVSKSRLAVARLLKEARVNAGLNQAGLAERLGVRQSFVSKYETGERRLDVGEVHEICSALGLPFIDFAIAFAERFSE